MGKVMVIAGFVFFSFIFLPNSGACETPILRINCTVHSSYEAFFVRLLEEICKRNAVVLQKNTPPVGRSLIHVNQGLDDGDGPRIAGLSSAFPNIILVPEPFGEFHFGAFIKSPKIKINGWTDLANLNVVYLHGWKIFDNQVHTPNQLSKWTQKTFCSSF